MYDGILPFKLPSDAKIIGFADDIALVVVAKHLRDLKTATNCNSSGTLLADGSMSGAEAYAWVLHHL